jgi:hypothetical protein
MTETEMNITPSKYRSYLLRLWTEDPQNQSRWRIVLISPKTGKRRGFEDFEQLGDFLREEFLCESDPISREEREFLSE